MSSKKGESKSRTSLTGAEIPNIITEEDLANEELRKAFVIDVDVKPYQNKLGSYITGGFRGKDEESIRKKKLSIADAHSKFGPSTQKVKNSEKIKTTISFSLKDNKNLDAFSKNMDKMFADAIYEVHEQLFGKKMSREVFDESGIVNSVRKLQKDKKKAEEYGPTFSLRIEDSTKLYKKEGDEVVSESCPVTEFQLQPTEKARSQGVIMSGVSGSCNCVFDVFRFHLGDKGGRITEIIPVLIASQVAIEAKQAVVEPMFPGLKKRKPNVPPSSSAAAAAAAGGAVEASQKEENGKAVVARSSPEGEEDEEDGDDDEVEEPSPKRARV